MAVNDMSDPEMPALLGLMEEYRRLYDFGSETFDRRKLAHLYRQDEDFTAYDLAPPARGYLGWKEYAVGQVELMDKFSEFHFAYEDDLRVLREGNVAWGSASGFTYGKSADGQSFKKEMRVTLIWVKTNGTWLIAHEHASAPRLFELAGGVKL